MSKFVILEEYECGEFRQVMINVDKITIAWPVEQTYVDCALTMIGADGFNLKVKGTFEEVTNKIKHVSADNTKYNIKF